MTFWLAAAALAALVAIALGRPLLSRSIALPSSRAAYNLTVYQDQLREVEGDLERGLVSTDQATAARTEIERRMLAVAERESGEVALPTGSRHSLVAAVLVGVPVAAFGFYGFIGSPDLPGQPLAERQAPPHVATLANGDVTRMTDQLVIRLKENPNDLASWLLLARSNQSLNRLGDAADAYRRAITISNGRPDIVSVYGEVLVKLANGTVTPDAKNVFDQVLMKAPTDPRARFYLGLGQAQSGDRSGALQTWTDLRALSPARAPWLADLNKRLRPLAKELGVAFDTLAPSKAATELSARLHKSAPSAARKSGPSRKDVETASKLTATDREAMIRAMVGQLAERLKNSSGDLAGWLRLARAYEVLGETEKAQEARKRADALGKQKP